MSGDLKKIETEYQAILEQLSNPELISNWPEFEGLTKRKNFLEKIIEKEKEVLNLKNRIEENKSIISSREDPELVILAETELNQLLEKGGILEKELADLLKVDEDKSSSALAAAREEQETIKSIIVEIRAGTGGEEATLFVADLFKMYSKYAFFQGWQQKILDSHPTDLDGFKEIIFELKSTNAGKGNVFSKMKHEGGVHRVQRIPLTEKSGRIHTSTVSVAVLPRPKKTEFKIRPEDLKIDFYRASGKGGQNVNKRETAVRITHLPTGLVVTSQTERNQLQNKENALSILEARLLEKREDEQLEKLGGKRNAQIGGAKRAEKVRTYNFPQNRLTDHRIKKNWHNLEEIMAGKLESIMSALDKNLKESQ